MSERPDKAIEIFYSYSHKDEDLRDELEKHLSILERQGVITGWHDRRIGAGREWEGEIDTHLNTADVILLLVSADFLASDYCYDIEMKRAMERHEAGEARVIPVILRPVIWKGAPFGKLQALPKDAKPVTSWLDSDQAFENVAQGIQAAVEKLVGSSVGSPPSIGTALELKVLRDSGVNEESPKTPSKLAEDTSPKRRVQIYLQGDFSSLSADRQSAAIAAFAAVTETSPQEITVYRVAEGSIVFDLGIPSDAAQRLRFLLQSNDAQLRLLGVEKIILETESGEIEEWVIKEGKFDLATSLKQEITHLLSPDTEMAAPEEGSEPVFHLYPRGGGEIDYTLITRLFHDCREVRLYSSPSGFGESLVFWVESWDRQRIRQRPMVLKLGPRRKIEAEEQNYHTFVEPYIGNTLMLKGAEYERGRGAILFTSSLGKALTFEEFYSDTERRTADDVVAVIKEIFQNALQPWLEGTQTNPHSRLYQTYSLAEDWEKIHQAVSDLGFALEADYFYCLGRRFPNPLKETQEWFKIRREWECITRDAIVHGDLNSRNILIDSNRNVFVIDFSKTGWSHLLQDFCRLEAEIKFCLTRLHCDDDIEQAIALEEELLLAANGEPFADLEGLLNVNPVANTDPRLERARRSVMALRRIASRSMGLQVTEPAEQCYLGLLHYTLDTLRYEQCDRNSKLYALISASLLCRALR